MKTVTFSQDELNFINHIFGTVEVNGARVSLQGVVSILSKLNAEPAKQEELPIPRGEVQHPATMVDNLTI